MLHGAPTPIPVEALLDPDPALQLARADLAAWLLAHPCSCVALCGCDREEADRHG